MQVKERMREGQDFQVADSSWLTTCEDSDMTAQCILEIRNNSSVTKGGCGGMEVEECY